MDGCSYLNFPSHCFLFLFDLLFHSFTLFCFFIIVSVMNICILCFLFLHHCQCNECLDFVFRSFDPHFPIFAELVCLCSLFKAFSLSLLKTGGGGGGGPPFRKKRLIVPKVWCYLLNSTLKQNSVNSAPCQLITTCPHRPLVQSYNS